MSSIPLKWPSIVDILRFGANGLGFLLAFLAYLLLRQEQGKQRTKDAMLKTINTFMIFAFLLGVSGFASEYLRFKSNPEASQKLESQVNELQRSLENAQQNLQEYKEFYNHTQTSAESARKQISTVLAILPLSDDRKKSITDLIDWPKVKEIPLQSSSSSKVNEK